MPVDAHTLPLSMLLHAAVIRPRYPWCKEGPSAHDPDEDVCVVDSASVSAVLRKKCIGKPSCTVKANTGTFGVSRTHGLLFHVSFPQQVSVRSAFIFCMACICTPRLPLVSCIASG